MIKASVTSFFLNGIDEVVVELNIVLVYTLLLILLDKKDKLKVGYLH